MYVQYINEYIYIRTCTYVHTLTLFLPESPSEVAYFFPWLTVAPLCHSSLCLLSDLAPLHSKNVYIPQHLICKIDNYMVHFLLAVFFLSNCTQVQLRSIDPQKSHRNFLITQNFRHHIAPLYSAVLLILHNINSSDIHVSTMANIV